DQVTLGLAGVLLHYKRHSIPDVANGMVARIEKRWAAMDQSFFVLALILNPYERLSRFGDEAGVSVFTLNSVFMELYRRVKSRPVSTTNLLLAEDALKAEKKVKETAVLKAFLQYLGLTSDHFRRFEEHREEFEELNGNDPILVWQQFLPVSELHELADFAILILGIAVNQGATERVFSDLKIKRTRLRNKLSYAKTEKMFKVGADIRSEHLAAGFRKLREGRKNHDERRVGELIAIPKYADLVEDTAELGTDDDVDGEERVSSRLVNSRAAWRKVYTSWAVDACVEEMAEEEEIDISATVPVPEGRPSKWLPRPLGKLFGGTASKPLERRQRKEVSEEALYMELLAAAHSDEEPDDGELEGSGDEYIGDAYSRPQKCDIWDILSP
ncbi:DUF659 domain-containing protein, partial [Favolaschia claudopus]